MFYNIAIYLYSLLFVGILSGQSHSGCKPEDEQGRAWGYVGCMPVLAETETMTETEFLLHDPILMEAIRMDKEGTAKSYTVTDEDWDEIDRIFASGNKQESRDALYKKITFRT
jgi:hypothetical protein